MKKYYKSISELFLHLQRSSLLLALGFLLLQIKFPIFANESTKMHLPTTLWGLDFFSLHEIFLLFFLLLQLKEILSSKWYYFLPPLLFLITAILQFFLWEHFFSLLKVRYILEYWFFALCIVRNTHFTKIFWHFLLIGGIMESMLCLIQFFLQRPLGLSLLYEAPFSSSQLGSAKILLQEHSIVRAYGTFEHPNITAFFLIGALAATTLYPMKQKIVRVLLVTLLLLGLLLTFSKTAIGALIFSAAIILAHSSKKNIRSLLNYSILLCLTISIPVLIFFFGNSMETLTDRLLYLEQSIHINSFFTFFVGHGFGFSPFALLSNFSFHVMPWQLQPIHSFFPLIFYEGGITATLGGILIFLPILQYFFIYKKHSSISTLLLCSGIFFFALTDHTLLTSQIGLLLLSYTSILLYPNIDHTRKKIFTFLRK